MKKVFIFLCLCLGLVSCNNTRQIVRADINTDHFSYSIGKGETIFIDISFYYSILNNKEFDEYITAYADYHLKTTQVKLKDGSNLDSSIIKYSNINSVQTIQLTCLKEFDEPIYIDRLVFESDKAIIDYKCDLELTYNDMYLTRPPFPLGYTDNVGLLVNLPMQNIVRYGKTYYFYMSKRVLNLSKEDDYILKSISSYNRLFSIDRIEYTETPRNFYDLREYDTFDYKPFEEVNINKLENGIIVKFDIIFDDSLYTSVGSDVFFHITLNGDSYTVPLHIFFQVDRKP